MLKTKKVLSFILTAAMILGMFAFSASAADVTTLPEAMSDLYGSLDRGIIAAKVTGGVHLSWRLFKEEVDGYSATGLTGANFNLYRDGVQIATITDSTNYLDAAGTGSNSYFVRAVVNGVEKDQSKTVTPLAQTYLEVAAKRPASVTVPGSSTPQTYSMRDMSYGDVDGDGVFEIIVEWTTGFPDVIGEGMYAPVIFDCYKLDGTPLWRIDLGVNIRPGSHYSQFMVQDYDGDGKVEMMVKTAPGTKTMRFKADGTIDESSVQYITMPQSDIDAGWSHSDDYRSTDGLAGVAKEDGTYFKYYVDFFMNWENHPEVLNGNWTLKPHEMMGLIPGGRMASKIANYPTFTYPLSKEQAVAMTNLLYDFAVTKNGNVSLASQIGYIFLGPEYLTVFNGETGREMDTIPWAVPREDSGLMWGDYATKTEPNNRVDRFLGCVAYLDGDAGNPSAIMVRGYYTRSTLTAYDWDGQNLSVRWLYDTGFPVYNNPFDTQAHGIPGRLEDPANSITTQGQHSITVADLDGDGADEIVHGGCAIDNDGSLMYTNFFTIEEGPNAGLERRLGHGDSLHLADIDPDRPGFEVWSCHEEAANTRYGEVLRDALTGEVIFGTYYGGDNGRSMIGDFDTNVRGIEMFSRASSGGRYGMQSATGVRMNNALPSTDGSIFWSADLTTQTISTSGSTMNVQKSRGGTQSVTNAFSATGIATTGGKNNAGLIADIFGDYREELILASSSQTSFRIYFNSAEVSNHKLFTLMHDRRYRAEVARQNTTYNQPSYTSFYYASDMSFESLYISLKGAVASTDKARYTLNEPIKVSVKTDVSVDRVSLYNETNNSLVVSRSVEGNLYSDETWTLTIGSGLGTKGTRTLKVYVDGVYSGVDVTFTIGDPIPENPPAPAFTSAKLVGSEFVAVNTPFTVQVITDTNTTKVTLYGENGTGLVSTKTYVDNGNVRTWTLQTSLGSAGDRVLRVKYQGADLVWVDSGVDIKVKIRKTV